MRVRYLLRGCARLVLSVIPTAATLTLYWLLFLYNDDNASVLPGQNPVILWYGWTAGLICGWLGATFDWRLRSHVICAALAVSIWWSVCALSGLGGRESLGMIVFSGGFVLVPMSVGTYFARVITGFWLAFVDALIFERDT
jgi:hypothetical protein